MAERDFTWDAADYHRHSAAQLGWAIELVDKLALQPREDVLDIGCGDGKITARIAAQVAPGRVVGIDNSAGMIDFAGRTFGDVPNLRFEPIDARAMAFENEFDVVFSNAALHWIVDHRPVLRGVARALRPGGRVLIQCGGQGNAASILRSIDWLRERPRWRDAFGDFPMPYGFHGPDEYRLWLAEAGLIAERVELLPKDMVQQGAEGLAGWVRTTWLPYLERLEDADRPAFVDELVTAYLAAHPLDSDGRSHVAMVRLEVAAHRPGEREVRSSFQP